MLLRWAHRCGAVLVLPGLAACDPSQFLRVRQALRPAPSPTCLEATLRASPLVREVTTVRATEDAHFAVVLHDSLAEDSTWSSRVTRTVWPDSAALVTVSFTWFNYGRPRNAAEQARVQGLAAMLLGGVRGACAPTAPAPVECHYGWRAPFFPGQTRVCPPAG